VEQVASILSQAIGRPVDPQALIGSSPFLKHDKLRDWIGYIMLRRIGKLEMTHPVEYAGTHIRLMREAFDYDAINALFAAERRKNPKMDAWLSARHVSTYTAQDLAAYPENSLGGIFHRHVVQMGYDLDLGTDMPLKTDFDYWMIRGLQFHDLEHLLSGAGFNLIGEIMPSAFRQGSLMRHLSPELAGALNAPTYFLNLSQLSGCMLYTPAAYPLLFDRFQRAWSIGQSSGPYFMARLEDVFHLPLDEARRALDINNVDDADTTEMSAYMLDERAAA
jgi:ubiquinone biosynthesis protein COQ4